MSNVYFSSDYIPKKRNNQREALVKEYARLQALENQPQYSTSNNNLYKTGFLVLCGALLMGCIWGVYTIGYKSGKRKYKYKKCKY